MTSQTDLDQGGTFRSWVRTYLGPSVGWTVAPRQSILPITIAGTYTLDPNVTLVTVNVAGAVTIILPPATQPAYQGAPGAQPGLFANNPITIVDIGNNAQAHPITIQRANNTENIMGLASIQITVNYGGYVLQPNSALKGWNSVSP